MCMIVSPLDFCVPLRLQSTRRNCVENLHDFLRSVREDKVALSGNFFFCLSSHSILIESRESHCHYLLASRHETARLLSCAFSIDAVLNNQMVHCCCV